MTPQNKRLTALVLVIALLLLIPFIAMQFTDEVKWTPFDFAIAAVLLLGAGLLCELVFRKIKRTTSRIIICWVVLAVFFLIWAELAVGIFGTAFGGN